MKIGDGAQQPKRGILLPMFNVVHVCLTATDDVGNMLVTPTARKAQLCDHCPKSLLRSIGLAFQRFGHLAGHARIIGD